jgi:hypothetical protein
MYFHSFCLFISPTGVDIFTYFVNAYSDKRHKLISIMIRISKASLLRENSGKWEEESKRRMELERLMKVS